MLNLVFNLIFDCSVLLEEREQPRVLSGVDQQATVQALKVEAKPFVMIEDGIFHGSIRCEDRKVSADGITKMLSYIIFVVNVTEIGFHNRINVFHQLLSLGEHIEVF